ncbi:hypothetical protein Krac_9905 [Ktedonobacter racemifer DSM 44963]|uniref:Uncharacterized protein n=1 Tax=Ktedonobacter racemifer DSM 44963 TaxID=485913 RepID=D6TE66_KTERA|nr:hypothetical protein Krac_9905 [Ktedonobacter racemifer DSM 44963]
MAPALSHAREKAMLPFGYGQPTPGADAWVVRI